MSFSLKEHELFTNAAPRLPICICADISGSMSGEPIQELNGGVQVFCDAVRKDEQAKQSAELALVAFGSSASTLKDFGPVPEVAPQFDANGGSTSLGSGVALSLNLLDARKQQYQSGGVEYFQPWLVILTDGHPTDNSHKKFAPTVRDLVERRKLSVFAVGIGDDVSLTELEMLSPKRRPVLLRGLDFSAMFEWLSKSVVAVSRSTPGQAVPLSAPGWVEV